MQVYFLILVGWDLEWPDNVPQIEGFTLRDETTFYMKAGSFKTEEDIKKFAIQRHKAKDNNLVVKSISQVSDSFKEFPSEKPPLEPQEHEES